MRKFSSKRIVVIAMCKFSNPLSPKAIRGDDFFVLPHMFYRNFVV
jgi:hypothetical protein